MHRYDLELCSGGLKAHIVGCLLQKSQLKSDMFTLGKCWRGVQKGAKNGHNLAKSGRIGACYVPGDGPSNSAVIRPDICTFRAVCGP